MPTKCHQITRLFPLPPRVKNLPPTFPQPNPTANPYPSTTYPQKFSTAPIQIDHLPANPHPVTVFKKVNHIYPICKYNLPYTQPFPAKIPSSNPNSQIPHIQTHHPTLSQQNPLQIHSKPQNPPHLPLPGYFQPTRHTSHTRGTSNHTQIQCPSPSTQPLYPKYFSEEQSIATNI